MDKFEIKDEKTLGNLFELINGSKVLTEKKQHLQCPFCESHDVVSNGKYKDRKRYKCKKCKKSYNDYTGTIYSYIQNLDKLNEFMRQLLMGKTAMQLSRDLDICKNTSSNWKGKIVRTLKNKQLAK